MKKISILFGSESDKPTYEPLKNDLEKDYSVDLQIISAHRNPDELEKYLKQSEYDLIVAGAGLAAHLPGVIASKVKVPVIGIPVDSYWGGLDSFASIVQMPFGVPVISSAPGSTKDVRKFLNEIEKMKSEKFNNINLVLSETVANYEYAANEINRTKKYATQLEMVVETHPKVKEGFFNIVYVSKSDDVQCDKTVLHVPLLDKSICKDPHKFSDFFTWATKGGFWIGTNNTRNALLSIYKLKTFARA
ncbi:MAG: AIR carboxylase family protein [Halobacteriovoraceae bacterium]|nr:AIR carboxylase family protein [Halobacteriovoraceae bacterium]